MDRQAAALDRWLADHPEYQLAEALVDPGISAGRGRNRRSGALSKFIEGGRTGTVPPGSCLVVESMSRFSREIATTTLRTLLNDVWGAGLAISFCTDGVVLDEELIAREDHRLHAILGAIGQARREWEERSRRSKGAAAKARGLQEGGRAVDGVAPWWMERDPTTGRLVRDADGSLRIDPISLATIKRAAQLAVDGYGTTHVARILQAEGRQAPCRRTRGRVPGDPWSHSQVAYMLRQEALIGTLVRSDGTKLPGYYPPVLSLEEWARLRDAAAQRHRAKGQIRSASPHVRFLLQTIARCDECGGPLSYLPPTTRARPDHPGWVGCRGRGGTGCGNRKVLTRDMVEAHCLTRLGSALWEEFLPGCGNDEDVARLVTEEASTRLERDRLQGRLEAAKGRARDAWLGTVTEARQVVMEEAMAHLGECLAAAEVKLAGIEQELASARSKPSAADAAAELRERVRTFWSSLPAASAGERLAFNRWLLARGIEFRITPPSQLTNDRVVRLMANGVEVGPPHALAPKARLLALATGRVNPERAVDRQVGGRVVPVVIDVRSGTTEELEQFMGEPDDEQSEGMEEGVVVSVDLDWDEDDAEPDQ